MFNQINVWHEAGLGRGGVGDGGGGGLKEKEIRNGWFYPCDFLLQPNSFTFKTQLLQYIYIYPFRIINIMKDGRRKQEWFKGFDVTEFFGCHGTNDRALIGGVPVTCLLYR